ncbi:MAG: helix-turn-helix domain-containing protein [Kiritimatiellia bacterium]|jgi:AraC-like DNA-binding protein
MEPRQDAKNAMTRLSDDWQEFSMSLAALRRISPHELPVDNIGYQSASVRRLHWPVGGKDFALSFVFGGHGKCKIFGKTWDVVPPCIFTTWPGEPMEFGTNAGAVWEEFYICYATKTMPSLKRRRLARPELLTWPIHNPQEARRGLMELRQLLNDVNKYGQADRIDRLCDAILTDTLITHEARMIPDDTEQTIKAIESHIIAHLTGKIDFDALARRHGLSPSHFRRLWRKFFSLPPAHYVLDQRVQEACRLLTGTDLRINEIATALGFEDTQYFSRQFRRLTGYTASSYRRLH